MTDIEECPNGGDHSLHRWTCGCDPWLLGIQAAAAATGNIDVRVVTAPSTPRRDPAEPNTSA